VEPLVEKPQNKEVIETSVIDHHKNFSRFCIEVLRHFRLLFISIKRQNSGGGGIVFLNISTFHAHGYLH
jgi:hypothetical protein